MRVVDNYMVEIEKSLALEGSHFRACNTTQPQIEYT